ncbi:PH domain-like protein [Hesseltinella vesiculosa]|uniref:PH domain-like protein n=1 Tax=Hesseltinella vesiculosa TaxID=101127 RepID=A0A1X2GJG0_9FUNG|nr:PH domain-like protein [Hesseltinella vesiculosa]
MSSPPDSIHSTQDMDDAFSKKRGRAQSVEPVASPKDEAESEKMPTVSAPKKTKRDEDNLPTSHSMTTIRKNLKDMSTADKPEHMDEAMSSTQGTDDDDLTPTASQQEPPSTKNFSQFGGNSNSDDWGEFAEEEEGAKPSPVSAKAEAKYTFGASSGFGTKAWASSAAAAASPAAPSTTATTQKSTFGGFTSAMSGFGSFATTNHTNSASDASTTASGFGAFAKPGNTSSPFALAASSATSTNALSACKANALSPTDSHASSVGSEANDNQEDHETNGHSPASEQHAFGEGAKIKVPGVKETEVVTGEEDEDTIYQTKAKLLVLDGSNWKERGTGTLRINCKGSAHTRLVMRADSVFRLILNLSLFAEMKVFIMQERFVRFAAFEPVTNEDGSSETKLVNYALKCPNRVAAEELLDHITLRIPKKCSSDE